MSNRSKGAGRGEEGFLGRGGRGGVDCGGGGERRFREGAEPEAEVGDFGPVGQVADLVGLDRAGNRRGRVEDERGFARAGANARVDGDRDALAGPQVAAEVEVDVVLQQRAVGPSDGQVDVDFRAAPERGHGDRLAVDPHVPPGRVAPDGGRKRRAEFQRDLAVAQRGSASEPDDARRRVAVGHEAVADAGFERGGERQFDERAPQLVARRSGCGEVRRQGEFRFGLDAPRRDGLHERLVGVGGVVLAADPPDRRAAAGVRARGAEDGDDDVRPDRRGAAQSVAFQREGLQVDRIGARGRRKKDAQCAMADAQGAMPNAGGGFGVSGHGERGRGGRTAVRGTGRQASRVQTCISERPRFCHSA